MGPDGGPGCDRPFRACSDGSACSCPGPGTGCAFRYRRCANGKSCRRQCNKGQPHCPWFTKNRNRHDGIRIHNDGDNRPVNKEGGHNWGGDFPGNRPYPDLVNFYGPFGKLNGDRNHFTDRFASNNGDLNITQVDVFQGNFRGHENVIVGIQIYYGGVAGDLHGRSTGGAVSLPLGAGETIEKITIRSSEEGLSSPNNLIFSLDLETNTGIKISTRSTNRGKMHVIPQVRDNVNPKIMTFLEELASPSSQDMWLMIHLETCLDSSDSTSTIHRMYDFHWITLSDWPIILVEIYLLAF